MNTFDRVCAYSPDIDPSIVEVVAEHAELQAGYKDYSKYLLDTLGVEIEDFPKNTQFLDVKPDDYDTEEAVGIFLPFGNSLDSNQLFSLATIVGSNPDKRFIAMANPGRPGANAGRLKKADRVSLKKSDFSPAVQSFGKYIEDESISRLHTYGGSYGANLAVAATALGCSEPKSLTVFDPVDIKYRRLDQLIRDFISTNGPMKGYIHSTGLETFEDAFTESGSAASFLIGLARATNISAGIGLTKGKFSKNINTCMRRNPQLKSTLAWSGDSEMCDDYLMSLIAVHMQKPERFGDRVATIRLPGQFHSVINDLHLQATIVGQGLQSK